MKNLHLEYGRLLVKRLSIKAWFNPNFETQYRIKSWNELTPLWHAGHRTLALRVIMTTSGEYLYQKDSFL